MKQSKPSSKGASSTKFKSDCADYCPVLSPSRIVITSRSGSVLFFDEVVDEHEKFEITNVSNFDFVKVHIYNVKTKRNSQSFVIDLPSSDC